MSLRLSIYRYFQKYIVERWILPHFFSKEHIQNERTLGIDAKQIPPRKKGVRRIWFHAASVGELESLWTVIINSAQRPEELVLTVFSESAIGQLARLRDELSGKPVQVIYAGYSPWEGRWGKALGKIRPSVFISAKYDAWPELWASLAEFQVPLIIVGARARKSLRVAKNICRALGTALPRMMLLATGEKDTLGLKGLFPTAAVRVIGEPRWDRVDQRSKKGSPRAKEIVALRQSSPRPWGILGQVWPEDLAMWSGLLKSLRGTLWIVPHRTDRESVDRLEAMLREEGLTPEKTSESNSTSSAKVVPTVLPTVLVDEMGFLSELYATVDWAYVGGGFGVSVHSTIEPAIQGIPIAVGPKGFSRFPEIQELAEIKQLTVVRSKHDLESWMASMTLERRREDKERWLSAAQARMGATERTLSALDQWVM